MRIAIAFVLSLFSPIIPPFVGQFVGDSQFTACSVLVIYGAILGLCAGKKYVRFFWVWPILGAVSYMLLLKLIGEGWHSFLQGTQTLVLLFGAGVLFTVLAYKLEDCLKSFSQNRG